MKKRQGPLWNVNIFLSSSKARDSKGLRRVAYILLGKLGPTWRYSPLRRISQVLCLALFCYLFFYVAWPYAAVFSERVLEDKERLPVESFLWLDPLVGISSAVACRQLNVALLGMGGVLLVCLFFTRGFCGYICPLGTLIDGFDWLIGGRIRRFRLKSRSWWSHSKYFLLTAVLISASLGVLVSGYVAAIPVLTRGLLFTGGRIQLGLVKGWIQVSSLQPSAYVSLVLFACMFFLGLLGKRFWCRYVCPSGALFSVFSFLRIGERKVSDDCIGCRKCIDVCPFDAIKEDYTTRTMDCTFCQTCGGACPTGAINFVTRWNNDNLKEPDDTRVPCGMSRRDFVVSGLTGAGAAVSVRTGFKSKSLPLRPPGSVPEREFLDLCVRCGECFKVCPGPVLHPAGLEYGLEALWTPVVVPSHAGCHSDCNFCTQVCPTQAIEPLSLQKKRKTSIGLAVINTKTCLPHAGQRDCRLCFEECEAAGYNAIVIKRIKLQIGDVPEGVFSDEELEAMSSIEAPFVDSNACVGCGLCEYRCHTAYTKQEQILSKSAVKIRLR